MSSVPLLENDRKFFMIESPSKELIELYLRFAKLSKQIVRLQAELDNVRELIRQQG